MVFLRSTTKSHFRWLFKLKMDHYNKKRKKQIEKKGYKFIHIDNFEKLRNFDEHEGFKWDKNRKTNTIYKNNQQILKKTIKKKRKHNLRRSPRNRSYSQIPNNSLRRSPRKRSYSQISNNN